MNINKVDSANSTNFKGALLVSGPKSEVNRVLANFIVATKYGITHGLDYAFKELDSFEGSSMCLFTTGEEAKILKRIDNEGFKALAERKSSVPITQREYILAFTSKIINAFHGLTDLARSSADEVLQAMHKNNFDYVNLKVKN